MTPLPKITKKPDEPPPSLEFEQLCNSDLFLRRSILKSFFRKIEFFFFLLTGDDKTFWKYFAPVQARRAMICSRFNGWEGNELRETELS